jgi:TonB family protein
MSKIFTILLIFVLSAAAFAQKTESAKWTKIANPKDNFSFALPADFLVDNEDDKSRAFANQDGVSMRVEMDEGGGKSRLNMYRQVPSPLKNGSTFTLGDFTGDVYMNLTKGFFTMSAYVASPKAFYLITVSSKDNKSPALNAFLLSIKFGDKPLLKQENPAVSGEEKAVSLASLPTSPIILAALSRKTSGKFQVKYDEEKVKYTGGDDKDDLNDNPAEVIKYSRSLIILRKPQTRYTDSARQEGVQGTIRLRIVFRADGQIGDITVLHKLGGGLTESAIDAARQIKFLPAEIDGKAVDVTKTIEYSFTIY